jgi:hypothetical protein
LNTIREIADTDHYLRMLGVAVDGLHRRKKEVQREIKEPGVLADRERLHLLLKELFKIKRTLYGLSAGGLP